MRSVTRPFAKLALMLTPAFACVVGCGEEKTTVVETVELVDAGPPADFLTVDRSGDTVTVRIVRGEAERLNVALALTATEVTAEYRDEEGFSATVRSPREATRAEPLAVATGHDDRAAVERATPKFRIVHGPRSWDSTNASERGEAQTTILATKLGTAMDRLGRIERPCTAKLIEAQPLFEAIRQMIGDPLGRSGFPGTIAEDLSPPGMLPGDTPALGMKCSEKIKCPSASPICATLTHDEEFGWCTRACSTNDDCTTPLGDGRCGIPLSDIPGFDGSVIACVVRCQPDRSCAGLLRCNDITDSAKWCLPEQK